MTGGERTWTIYLPLLLIPITIGLGIYLGDRYYLWISLGVLAETMLPFVLLYEKRHIRAREVAMIAILCALTVMGNLLSVSILPVQMGTAMVIVSGIAFGPETGFLVGALSRLLVNFFLGQGAWTPWQMFAWGLIGFLSGFTFNKVIPSKTDGMKTWREENRINSRSFQLMMGPVVAVAVTLVVGYISYLIMPLGDKSFLGWRVYAFGLIGLVIGAILQRRRLPVDTVTVTIYTFFVVLLIYGGIMNLSTVVTASTVSGGGIASREFWDSARVYYISGLPYDLWHAFRAAFVIFLFGNVVLGKLERIKIKYGFYRR